MKEGSGVFMLGELEMAEAVMGVLGEVERLTAGSASLDVRREQYIVCLHTSLP